ncbi:hypothetical protein [Fibrobacter sp. UWB7]|uniref:hypothetical protein n=1 Tax=Fibrobacter sp. UWB7 TaxID=1896206 RepID=UPI0009176FFD|nr:hypothetical protein [Fibrobacter sp. UWB7]SHM42087.1 hypothetical protein SAMN05720467_1266 [Fibrobacter sp. UWB7]
MKLDFASIKDCLRFSRNAYFYKRNGLLQADVDSALQSLKKGAYHYSSTNNNIDYQIVIFKCKPKIPSFASNENFPWKEIKLGYFFILMDSDYVAILKQNTNIPSKISNKLYPIEYEQLTKFHIDDKTKFKSVNMQNIDGQKTSVWTKSYIADDLKRNISGVDAGNFIVRSLRGKNEKNRISICVNSSRINQYGSKIQLEEICSWIAESFNELRQKERNDVENNFISNFALQETFNGAAVPSSIFLHTEYLKSLFCETPIIESKPNFNIYKYLDSFYDSVKVKKDELGNFVANYKDDVVKVEFLSGKTNNRIWLSNKTWKKIKIIDQCLDNFKEKNLEQIINEENLFNVYFDKNAKVYSNGKLFSSSRLLNNAPFFLQYMSNEEMKDSKIESEKWNSKLDWKSGDSEEIRKKKNDKIGRMKKWYSKSEFFFVESKFSSPDSALFCDDLEDEWADFIRIKDDEVSFFVCKYKKEKKDSASASDFQDVVGQALKNLGNMLPSHEQLGKKQEKWSKKHSRTNIPRANVDEQSIEEYIKKWECGMMQPMFKKRMCLVVNFLNKDDFVNQIKKMQNDFKKNVKSTNKNEYAFQKLWILSMFVNACLQINVEPRIICK